MKAACVTRTGGLSDPGPGQVLVRVEALAVNPIDTDV